ncbi:MAG TPA: hypothetical protein ENK06_03120 [Gammaproteobacteria bacterium]|nr:hypothetical protein [Gammaproteobacteria bacterium]
MSALISQHALYLIFENPEHIPKPFYQQKKIHLLCVDTIHTQQIQQLTSKLNKRFAERHAQHGAFVIVYGRGIFIRGKSGAGKSQLLLNLIKNNHLWVADDLTNFYLNTQGQIIGEADNNLSEYIHIKGVGPIHVDKTYGQACRIRSHSLAAAIHLSDNIPQENPHISAYSQLDTLTLLNKKLPLWHFSSSNHNLPLLVEQCAKNLILEAWGHNAADGLENALNNALSRAQNNDSK